MTFQFKQFSVDDSLCAMKIGTDAVLLGSWTLCDKAKHILDIGTGSGILALMMAQKSQAEITAIEIEENAYKQAMLNFKSSKWKKRISLKHCALQEFTKENTKLFDVIISNPPYFTNSLKPDKNQRALARHTTTLSVEDLFKHATKLMHSESTFNIIYPTEYKERLLNEATKNNLCLIKSCDIQANAEKEANRIMLCFSKQMKELIYDKIIIEQDKRHYYTKEYINLTKDFYLKF